MFEDYPPTPHSLIFSLWPQGRASPCPQQCHLLDQAWTHSLPPGNKRPQRKSYSWLSKILPFPELGSSSSQHLAAPWGFKWVIFPFYTTQTFSLFLAGVVVPCQPTILPRISSHFLARKSLQLASEIQKQEQQAPGWRSDVSTPTLLYLVRTLQWPHQNLLQDWLDNSILSHQLQPFKNHVPVSSLMPEDNETISLIFMFLPAKSRWLCHPTVQ